MGAGKKSESQLESMNDYRSQPRQARFLTCCHGRKSNQGHRMERRAQAYLAGDRPSPDADSSAIPLRMMGFSGFSDQ